jgi:S1-C subfamily serine protease
MAIGTITAGCRSGGIPIRVTEHGRDRTIWLPFSAMPTPSQQEATYENYRSFRIDGQSIREFLCARQAVLLSAPSAERLRIERKRLVRMMPLGLGSAVAISGDGYFLTASHVVDRYMALGLSRPGGRMEWHQARTVWLGSNALPGADGPPDLAVLAIDAPVPAWCTPTSSDTLAVGTGLVLGGCHLRIRNRATFELDVAAGLIANDPILHQAGGFPVALVETTALARPGDSGGPAILLDGGLAGILVTVNAVMKGDRLVHPIATLILPIGDWLSATIEQDRQSLRDRSLP